MDDGYNLPLTGMLHFALQKKALSKRQISIGKIESAFVKNGFLNWKKAFEKDRGLLKHLQSSAHNDAVQRYVVNASA